MRPLLIGFCVVLLTAADAPAVDYAKIDRSLSKEPAYKSKSPKYGLLLFGPDAKLRVWLVLDGETLYLDRNGDGNLTAANKRFAKASDCNDIEIADPDGRTRYVIENVSEHSEGKPARRFLDVGVTIKGPVEYRQYCGLELKDSPRDAAIAHFNGPLGIGPRTINWKAPPGLSLVTGDKPADLYAMVGTMSAKYRCWVVARSHNGDKSAFPKGVHPVVDIEFPPKKPGEASVKRRYALDGFC